MIRKSKRKFESSIAESSKTNPKPFWAHVRGRLKTKEGVAPLLEELKDKTSMKFLDEKKANILLQQLSSVYTREPDGEAPVLPSRTTATLDKIAVTVELVVEAWTPI